MLFGERYNSLRRLTSARASADFVADALRTTGGSPLTWLGEDPVRRIESLEGSLKPAVERAASEADQRAVDLFFLYAAGHGHYAPDGPRILAQDSSGKVPTAGYAVREILRPLFRRRPKRVVALFDMCQTIGFSVEAPPRSWIEEVRSLVPDGGSLVLVMAASVGEVAFGGAPGEPSPFARALHDYFSEEGAWARSVVNIERDLDEAMSRVAITGTQRSFPVAIIHPDLEGSVFGVHVLRPKRAPEVRGDEDHTTLRRSIEERELESFARDKYVRSLDDLWPALVAESHQFGGSDLREILHKECGTQLVTGRSGSGKTLLAKALSTDLARGPEGVVPIYVNAAYLKDTVFGQISEPSKLSDQSRKDAVRSALLDYLGAIRYHCPTELLRPKAILDGRVRVIVDAIDEVQDQELVRAFLGAAAEFFPVVAFAHTEDRGWIGEVLGIPAGYSLPIGEHKPSAHGLPESFAGSLTPLQIQEALRHDIGDNRPTPKAVLDLRLDELQQALSRELAKSRFKALANSMASGRSRKASPAGAFDALQEFSLLLLTRRFAGQVPYEQAVAAMRHTLDFVGALQTTKTPKAFIDLLVRAGIMRRAGDHLRFDHRRTQSLLVAAAWLGAQERAESISAHSPPGLWKGPIGLYATLLGSRFDWPALIRENAVLAVGAMEESPRNPGPEQVEQLAEELLRLASRWTRGPAVGQLMRLPQLPSDWMKARYPLTPDINERVTICSVLAGQVDFLLHAYGTALLDDREGVEYLRRRILDALKGSLSVNQVLAWWEDHLHLSPRELIRHVRSLTVRDQSELERLQAGMRGRGLMKEPIFAAYSDFHEWSVHGQKIVLSSLEMHTKAALETEGDRWRRCLAALLIIELRLTRLSDVLKSRLRQEDDDYAKGEMGFALGHVGDRDDCLDLLGVFADHSWPEPTVASDSNRQGLLNDLALGLKVAVERESLSLADLVGYRDSISGLGYDLLNEVVGGPALDSHGAHLGNSSSDWTHGRSRA